LKMCANNGAERRLITAPTASDKLRPRPEPPFAGENGVNAGSRP